MRRILHLTPSDVIEKNVDLGELNSWKRIVSKEQ